MALGSDTSTEVSQTRLLLAGYKTHRSTAQQVKQPPIAEISPLAAGWFKQRRKILNLHELSWQSKEVSWAGLFTSCTMTYTWWESLPVTPTHLETLWRRDSGSSEKYKSRTKSYEHMLLLKDWDETWVAFACVNNYSSREALSAAKAHGICCFIEQLFVADDLLTTTNMRSLSPDVHSQNTRV